MGRRGRPPGTPAPGMSEPGGEQPPDDAGTPPIAPASSEPAHADDERAATTTPGPRSEAEGREPSTTQEPASVHSPPTFEDIFGASGSSERAADRRRDETTASRAADAVAPDRTASALGVEAIADAVGATTAPTPWATATGSAGRSRPPAEPASESAERRRTGPARATRRRSGKRGGIVILVAVVAVLAVLLGGGWALFGPAIMDRFAEPADYADEGSGEVIVRIEPGWTGAQVATMLEDEGVIADQQTFYDLLLADSSIGFQPGSYRLASGMSAQSALDAILDEANRVVAQFTIPEGFVIQQVFARLAEQTGIPEADFVQAASDPSAYGVAASTLEGWLFPATYTFDGGESPQQILQTMVDRMRQAMTERGLPEDQWQTVVTFASLVEREGGPTSNFPRVARVFQNRLDIGMLMESDATVHYGIGDFGVITTTDEERGDAGNSYNTYVHPGLPIGPIGAPGDAAIDAVLAPADGDWLFFVTVDPSTGETVFSDTFAEHQQAVLLFQAWLREHPEYGS